MWAFSFRRLADGLHARADTSSCWPTQQMNSSSPDSLRDTVRWLSLHTRFPASRLERNAEALLCFAAAAAAEEAAENQRFLVKSRDPAQTSALRTHALRRSQVHFKCDNSAKV